VVKPLHQLKKIHFLKENLMKISKNLTEMLCDAQYYQFMAVLAKQFKQYSKWLKISSGHSSKGNVINKMSQNLVW